jgi:hypothetical protein
MRGKAPTLADFARAWTDANGNKHRLLTAEYAYLTDLRHKRVGASGRPCAKQKRSRLCGGLQKSPRPNPKSKTNCRQIFEERA